jgi:Dual OB-containing domain
MGGRCIAGITRAGNWIRPVSSAPDGTLYPQDYILNDGSEPALLDIIRLEIAQARPEPYQPENWEITAARWRRCGHLQPNDASTFLRAHVTPGPDLLGNRSDRVEYQYIVDHSVVASLCVVEPAGLRWCINSTLGGRRQTRAYFTLSRFSYNLSVTDPIWENRCRDLSYGVHERAVVGIDARDEVFLTVSLGEPYQGSCYKLVAAVILLPYIHLTGGVAG